MTLDLTFVASHYIKEHMQGMILLLFGLGAVTTPLPELQPIIRYIK